MDMEAAQAAIYGRTGHTMMSSNPDSLPVHLQALDASAMHHGQEPLAKVWLGLGETKIQPWASCEVWLLCPRSRSQANVPSVYVQAWPVIEIESNHDDVTCFVLSISTTYSGPNQSPVRWQLHHRHHSSSLHCSIQTKEEP
eukprot:scaffold147275_cov19-Tisochrysis_lutea.AAC.1